jgi:hypothetical protein
MPILHESSEYTEYIYKALTNDQEGPVYKFNPIKKLYEYSNTLYPNKNYTKTFDPKFMERGDVIRFKGNDYRNHNKMIYDGKELKPLDTDIDDYGGVPSEFVVGDNEGEFDIGDFEDLIEHNTINWLSKDKLKEIEIFEKNDQIFGKVTIQGKKWIISFEISKDNEFNRGYGRHFSRKYECILEDDNIVINKLNPDKVCNAKYIIEASENSNKQKVLDLIEFDNKVNLIDSYNPISGWFLYQIIKDYKFNPNEDNISEFPITWQKKGSSYDSEVLISNKETFDRYKKHDEKELDKVYINEIICYKVDIKSIKADNKTLMNNIKKYIDNLIENYDNIKKRHPVNYEGGNILTMYM